MENKIASNNRGLSMELRVSLTTGFFIINWLIKEATYPSRLKSSSKPY